MSKLIDLLELQITGEWGLESEDDTGVYVLRTTNFTNIGVINYTNAIKRKISDKKVEAKRLIEGDIILEKSGGSDNIPVGRVVFCDKKINEQIYLCNNFTQVLRTNKMKAVSKYVLYFLMFQHKRGYTDLLQNKTTGIRNLQLKEYMNMVVPTPSLKQQIRIVEVLDKITHIINLRKEQNEMLDILIKSRFVEMFGDPISNPKGWNIKRLIDICNKLTDGTHFSPVNLSDGDYKYITAKNIKISGFDLSNLTYVTKEIHDSIYSRCNPEYGDVLYIKDGVTTGIAMVNSLNEEFSLLSSVALFKQKREIINGQYLCSVLNNNEKYTSIRKNMGGAAITRLTIAKLNVIGIPVPPINLQNQFDDFVQLAYKQKFELQKSLNELNTLFNALTQKYFV